MALYTMEDHLLDCCIPTYHPVTQLQNWFSFSSLPPCAHFGWHHCIMSSVTLSSFGNSTGCLLPSFKYDLHNLTPTRSTKMNPSGKPLNSCLNYLLHHCDCSISPTHLVDCTIFMISISACLNKLLLIIWPWLSPF